MRAVAYRLHPHTHTVKAEESPVGRVMHVLPGKSLSSYYLGLSGGRGIQPHGLTSGRLETEYGLKSGSFFQQLPVDMDDEAANA